MNVLSALLDLALPQVCPGCGRPAGGLCRRCRSVLAAVADAPLGRTRPDPVPAGFPAAAAAAAAYDGAVRGALLAHKEKGRLALADPLGRALAAAVRCLDPPAGVLLVPVPSSGAVVRARGHDHARRLATSAARQLGAAARSEALLVPVRRVADQAGLDTAGRAANLSGAFRAVRRVRPGTPVVVVDDVVTSGATLVEAARALAALGLSVHGAATVAATVRRRRSRSG